MLVRVGLGRTPPTRSNGDRVELRAECFGLASWLGADRRAAAAQRAGAPKVARRLRLLCGCRHACALITVPDGATETTVLPDRLRSMGSFLGDNGGSQQACDLASGRPPGGKPVRARGWPQPEQHVGL